MTNIFRNHREATLAAKAAEAAAGDPLPLAAAKGAVADGMGGIIRPDAATNAAALMLVKLTQDRADLKTYQSDELKAKAKAEKLPDYQNWLDAFIADPETLPFGQPNDVLFYCMIWHIDAGDIARALQLAELVLTRKVEAPANFKRTAGCLIAEEVAARALAALGTKAEFDADLITQVQLLTKGEDMADEARAKLFKAAAMLAEVQIDALEAAGGTGADGAAGAYAALIEQASASAARAFELHNGCGIKKLIEKLDRLHKKFEAERGEKQTAAPA